jgi:glycosyltransferase involved in cell wall biosynthesis
VTATAAGPRVVIPPVRTGPRPFWSVMLPTYNGDRYLADALSSVLAQDPGPDEMQIEVVDDCSTKGDPQRVIRDVGGTRVGFFRQPHNLGHGANFNTCLRRSRGEVVHLLHDDDAVLPGFYERLGAGLRDRPEVGAAFARHVYMDAAGLWQSFSRLERHSAGVLEGWLPVIASGQRLTTPSIVVRRSTYEALGGFDERIRVGGEDWEMWVRIATRFPVWFEPQVLAAYRVNRPESLTGSAQRGVALARDMLRAVDMVETYLPSYVAADVAATALRRARAMYGSWAAEAAGGLLANGERAAAAEAARLAWSAGARAPTLRALAAGASILPRRLTARSMR